MPQLPLATRAQDMEKGPYSDHVPLSPACLPSTHTRQFYVSIQPPVGELMAPVFMSENEFKKEQGEWGQGGDGGCTGTHH